MKPPQFIRYTALLFCLVGVSSTENERSNIQSRRTKSDKNASSRPPTNDHQSNLRRTAEWMSYPRISPQPRIVNGNDVPSPNRYPYYVALVDDRERIVCGGSLIASNLVLSAAHCGLTNLKYAILGKYYGQIDTQHSEAERIPISNTFSNPRFTLRDRSHDQLLVLLESPANSARPVVRLNLSEGRDSNIPTLSDRVTVVGLGQTYASTQPSSDPPRILQQVTMGVVSNTQCQQMYDEYEFFLPSISNDMVCLIEELKGQCYGDSGGPYLILGDKPEDDVQIGSVAWGIDCANEKYPAVGIRTYSGGDSFLIDTTCSIAINPPDYMKCSTQANQPTTPPPTISPTVTSSASPTQAPSVPPSIVSSSTPTNAPSTAPSRVPTYSPTWMASSMPTRAPTISPSRLPTATPTVMASDMPTKLPSSAPTKVRSDRPSTAPSTSHTKMESSVPTRTPTNSPTLMASNMPTRTSTMSPSRLPTATPTVMASDSPTKSPSSAPTKVKSDKPSNAPSTSPTIMVSDVPTSSPSNSPTLTSSGTPSVLPSPPPSVMPSTTFPSTSPTITCVQRAQFCSKGDTCCGIDVCYAGFCRPMPNTSKQNGGYYKEDLKLTRATNIGTRGSFQSIGIANEP